MKEHENREPVSLPGKPSVPVKEKEETRDVEKQPATNKNTDREGEAGSIPLDHDETIGIP